MSYISNLAAAVAFSASAAFAGGSINASDECNRNDIVRHGENYYLGDNENCDCSDAFYTVIEGEEVRVFGPKGGPAICPLGNNDDTTALPEFKPGGLLD